MRARAPGGGRDGIGSGPLGARRGLAIAAGLCLANALAAGGQQVPTAHPVALPEAALAPPLDPFEPEPAVQAERLRGLRPEIVRTILGDRTGGEIDLAALAWPAPGGHPAAVLFVEIDGASFLDANQASVAPVEVYAYALDPDGAVAGHLAEAFTLDVARHGEQVWNGGIRFVGWLPLPPGDYRLRVMVHNARSLATGLVTTRLQVPAAGAIAPAELPPPLIAGPPRRRPWLSVRGRGRPKAHSFGYPFAIGERPLLPAAWPVLVGGRASEARLFADALPIGALGGAVELLPPGAAAQATSAPEAVASAPAETRFETAPEGRAAAVVISFATPAAPPGRYRLRLRIETADGELSTAPLPVLVIDAGPQDRELLWSDLKGLFDALPPASAEPPGETRTAPRSAARDPRHRSSRRLGARYRQALAMAAGEAQPSALLDFEVAVLTRGGEEPLLRLRAAELAVAASLGRGQPELLLPLAALHDELFHLYRRRHLFSLVAHSRRLLEELAELYAELGGEPDAAASILASVGGYMQQMRSPGDSRRLFGRALEHAPDSPAALLALAASYEKYGEYGRAVRQLERLVAVRPDLEEARLRLALNLERIGDRPRSRELLEPLASGAGSAWVRALACQELARGLLESGSPEQAAALIEDSLQSMPERQALWVLLAHVQDRLGLLERSRESLHRVAARPAGGASERLIYDDWANGPLERARESLRRRSAGLRAALAEAVGAAEEAS